MHNQWSYDMFTPTTITTASLTITTSTIVENENKNIIIIFNNNNNNNENILKIHIDDIISNIELEHYDFGLTQFEGILVNVDDDRICEDISDWK